MKYIFLILTAALVFSGGHAYCQEQQPNIEPNSLFEEQQAKFNDLLIEYTRQQVTILSGMREAVKREQYDTAGDYVPDIPQYQQQLRRNRIDDDINLSRARLDDLRIKTADIENKKNELKLKVLNQNNRIPEWWDKAENEFIEKRRRIVQSGLRR